VRRLVKVELRRFFSRRLAMVAALAAVVISGLILFAAWNEAKPLPEAERQAAARNYQQAHDEWLRSDGPKQLADCKANEAQNPAPGESPCEYMEPRPEFFGKPDAVFAEIAPDILTGLSYLLAFIAFLVGAGFIGAEYSTGSLGNWLTFEPRRLRVYGSKLVAAGVGTVPLAAALLAVVTGGLWLIVDQLGTTAGTHWSVILGILGRSLALAVAAGVLGVVVASLLRHTAAAIGLAFGYLVIVEGIFGSALNNARPWLVKLNMDAWLTHGTTYYQERCASVPEGGYQCSQVEKWLPFTHSAIYLGVIAAVLLVLSTVVFRRRDIT
jgi:ABC-2 type transport system permease protein